MANLGNLYYEVSFKDNTKAGISSIEKRIKALNSAINLTISADSIKGLAKKGLNLNVDGTNIASQIDKAAKAAKPKVSLSVDAAGLISAIENALKSKTFNVNVGANVSAKASTSGNSTTVTTGRTQGSNEISAKVTSSKGGAYYAQVAKLQDRITQANAQAQSKEQRQSAMATSAKQAQRNEAQKAYTQELSSAKSAQSAQEQRISTLKQLIDLTKQYRGVMQTAQNLAGKRQGKQATEIAAGMQGRISGLAKAYVTQMESALSGSRMTVTHLPAPGSPQAQAAAQEQALKHASRRADIEAAFKNQAAAEKRQSDALKAQAQSYNLAAKAQDDYLRKSVRAQDAIAGLKKVYSDLASTQRGTRGYGLDQSKLEAARTQVLNSIRTLQSDPTKVSSGHTAQIRNATKVLQEYQKECKPVEERLRRVAEAAKVSGRSFQELAQQMQRTSAAGEWFRSTLRDIFSVYAAKELLMNLIQIGGEFEKQKLALSAMTGSMSRASTLYTQIKALAVVSPFGFGELTSYSKQLAAYGFQYKDIYSTTKKLADISAGVGVDMSRIILAYGQVFTAHYLRGQELRQFTEAGIPLVDALANRFTKLKGEVVDAGDVFKMISNKEVSFEDVKAVLDEMTGEGGRFHNMQETLSESLSGKWSNFKDQIEIMYSEIATANNGVLKGFVGMLTTAAKSWRTLGTIITGIVSFSAIKGALTMFGNLSSNVASRTLAGLSAEKAALEAEAATYERLIGLIEMKAAAQKTDTGSFLSTNNRYGTAVALQGARAMAAGQRLNAPTGFTGLNRFIWNRGAKIGELKRQLDGANGSLTKMGKLTTSIKIGFNQFGLSAASALAGIKAGFLSVFNWSTAIIVAISAGIALIMNQFQKAGEFASAVKETAEGLAETKKELEAFLEDNPVNVAIKLNDNGAMQELIKKYKEELENAPIDFSYAFAAANAAPDAAAKLNIYTQAIKDYLEATSAMKAERLVSEANAAIDASGGGWFNDDVTTNMKEHLKAVNDLATAAEVLNNQDIDNIVNRFKNIKEAQPYLDAYKKGLIDVRTLMQGLAGMSSLLFEKTPLAADAGAAFGQLDVHSNRNEAYNDIYKTIVRLKEAAASNGIDTQNLSDADFVKLQTIVNKISEIGQWSPEQNEMFANALSTQLQGAKNAAGQYISTWQNNYGIIKSILDELEKHSDVFAGKSKEEIRDALQSGGENGMKNAVTAAKLTLTAKYPDLASYIQNVLSSKSFYLDVYYRMHGSVTGTTSGLQDAFTDVVNGAGALDFKPELDALKPQDNMSAGEYSDYLSTQESNVDKEIAAAEKLKVKNQKLQKVLDSNKRKKKAIQYAKSHLGVQTKSDEKAEKAAAAAEAKKQKAQAAAAAAADKALRNYERKMQNEYDSLKRVKDMFEKLRELYGDARAMEKIRNSGLVSARLIPANVATREDFMKAYKNLMADLQKRISPKSDAMKKLQDTTKMDVFNLAFDIDKDALDKKVHLVENWVERMKNVWGRFEKFIGEGFSAKAAMKYVLGDDQEGNTGLLSAIYTRLSMVANTGRDTSATGKSVNISAVAHMSEEELKEAFGGDQQKYGQLVPLVKAYQEAYNQILESTDNTYRELVTKYRDYPEQIEAISNKRKSKISDFFWLNSDAESLQDELDSIESEFSRKNQILSELNELEIKLADGDTNPELQNKVKQLRAQYAEGKSLDDLQQQKEKLQSLLANAITPDDRSLIETMLNMDSLKEIGQIEMEALRHGKYQTFFDAVGSLSKDTAKTMYEELFDAITKAFDEGKLSAEDYFKTIDELSENLKKSLETKSDAYAYFTGGKKGLLQNRADKANYKMLEARVKYEQAKERTEKFRIKNGGDAKINKNEILRIQLELHEKNEGEAREEFKKARREADDAESRVGKNERLSEVMTKASDYFTSAGNFGSSMSSLLGASDSTVNSTKLLTSVVGSISQAAIAAANGDLNTVLSTAADAADSANEYAKAIQEGHARNRSQDVTNRQRYQGYYASLTGKYGLYATDDIREKYNKQLTEYRQRNNNNLYTLMNALDSNNWETLKKAMIYGDSIEELTEQGFDTAESFSTLGKQYAAIVGQIDMLREALSYDTDSADDIKSQIADLMDTLETFKAEALKTYYGIDLSSWANNLSSSLVEAFRNGTDAAEAFGDSVNDMLASISTNIISQSILLPQIQKLQEQVEAAYDINDPDSINSVIKLISEWTDTTGTTLVSDAKALYDSLNTSLGGKLSESGSSSSSMSSTIAGLTEETGTLLASYINAIRADVSMTRTYVKQIADETIPQVNALSEAQLSQMKVLVAQAKLIEANTQASASAAQQIQSSLSSVITTGSGGKAIRIQ